MKITRDTHLAVEGERAYETGVGFLSRVYDCVAYKVTTRREHFVAVFAGIGSSARVDPSVFVEVSAPSEGLPAHWALERSSTWKIKVPWFIQQQNRRGFVGCWVCCQPSG